MTEKKQKKQNTQKQVAKTTSKEIVTPRGRIFEGIVKRKFPNRITIEFNRTIFIQKYQRFLKKTTRIHARLPLILEHEIHVGDLVKVQECRPLSKTIHHIAVQKIKSKEVKVK